MSQAKVRNKVGQPATEASSQITLLCYCSYVVAVMLLQLCCCSYVVAVVLLQLCCCSCVSAVQLYRILRGIILDV